MNIWPPNNMENSFFVFFQGSCTLPKPSPLRAHAPQSPQVPPKDLSKRLQDPTRCPWALARQPWNDFAKFTSRRSPPDPPRGTSQGPLRTPKYRKLFLNKDKTVCSYKSSHITLSLSGASAVAQETPSSIQNDLAK